MTFIGSPHQIRRTLDLIEKTGAKYRVLSLTDAKFSLDSPLHRLTEKQMRVIEIAHNLGYYDSPRGIKSVELAQRLGVSGATATTRLRWAERRLIDILFERD